MKKLYAFFAQPCIQQNHEASVKTHSHSSQQHTGPLIIYYTLRPFNRQMS